jgi:hypothetical protein
LQPVEVEVQVGVVNTAALAAGASEVAAEPGIMRLAVVVGYTAEVDPDLVAPAT